MRIFNIIFTYYRIFWEFSRGLTESAPEWRVMIGFCKREVFIVVALAVASLCNSIIVAVGETQTVKKDIVTTGDLTSGYTIQPPDVILPDDAKLGRYRRIIQPFKNWTLICDENLQKKQRVCNITQSILDQKGEMVFSWSLAATEGGQPVLILRVPPNAGQGAKIKLDFLDNSPVILAEIRGCDTRVCISYQQVGPRLRAYIGKGAVAEISIPSVTASGDKRIETIRAPLEGLSEALSAI